MATTPVEYPLLLNILSRKATKTTGITELDLEVQFTETSKKETIPFGYIDGDTEGLAGQVATWLANNTITTAAYTPPAIAILRATAKQSVIAFAEDIGKQLTAGYPQVEQQAWTPKLAEAKAIVAGETNPLNYPIISAEIGITGATALVSANKVIVKAVLFKKASGLISGLRQQTFTAIDVAVDEAAIQTILTAAKTEAETQLTALLATV